MADSRPINFPLRLLMASLAGFVLAAAAGATFELIAGPRDRQRYPAPGEVVDIGGHRLHLNCSGAGEPAVVLEAGLGASSLEWSLVQQKVAQTTRVCSYDRAGQGWSDFGPEPRDANRLVAELAALLEQGHVDGPLVLAGHSFGGMLVRLFAAQHRERVAGIVLVDARHESFSARLPEPERQAEDAARQRVDRVAPVMARLGIRRFFGAGLYRSAAGIDTTSTPDDLLQAIGVMQFSPAALRAARLETAAMGDSEREMASAGTLDSLPLVVVSAPHAAFGEAFDSLWQTTQREQARLSTNGELRTAKTSSHVIQLAEPETVVSAIVDVVNRVRATGAAAQK